LPKLSPERLKLIQQAADKSPRLSAAGKRAVLRSLEAAAKDNAESPEVVIASLPVDRRDSVIAHVKDFMTFGGGIAKRGGEKLAGMSEAEWQRLVAGAANAAEE
jgi:hypothetical protein